VHTRVRHGGKTKVTITGVETGCSGDNITSLRNLEANLATILFVLLEGAHGPCSAANGYHMSLISSVPDGQTDPSVIAEGDDGLFVDLNGFLPQLRDFLEIGFASKPQQCRMLEDSDFCGQITTLEDNVSIGNVLYVLVDMGWCNTRSSISKHQEPQLARAKARSYRYQYDGCPAVAAMADWVLRSTKHIDMRDFRAAAHFDEYKQRVYEEAIQWETKGVRRAITPEIRALCEKRCGLRGDVQLQIERFFEEALPVLQPIVLPIMHLVPKWWLVYDAKYVMPERAEPILGYRRVNNYGDAAAQVIFEDGPRIAGAGI